MQGNVTLRLINVPWDQALDIVLQAKGLDKRRSGNVVWVAPQPEIAKYEQDKEDARIAIENRAEMVTEYIPISYGNAEDIAKLLTDEAQEQQWRRWRRRRWPQQPRLPVAARQHQLRPPHQHAAGHRHPAARRRDQATWSSKLDKPVDQVRDRGAHRDRERIVRARTGRQVRHQPARPGQRAVQQQLGNSIDRRSNATQRRQCSSAVAAATQAAATITRGLNVNLPSDPRRAPVRWRCRSSTPATLLDLELSALQTEGRGEVISNPRIVTSNQKEAVISRARKSAT